MKLLRKLFNKKDETEKKIEENKRSLKSRNIQRGIGTGIGVGLSAYAGNIWGELAKSRAKNKEINKGAEKILDTFEKGYRKIENKARSGAQLTEKETKFLNIARNKMRTPSTNFWEAREMAAKDEAIKNAAKKAGKRAKTKAALLVGGGLSAWTIGSSIAQAKKDKKRTEARIEKLKASSRSFSTKGEVTKKVIKSSWKSGKKFINDFDRSDYNKIKDITSAVIPDEDEKRMRENFDEKKDNIKGKIKVFSGREKVSKEKLKEAKKTGVIQKDSNGNWRIISLKAGEYWDAKYSSREKAEAALAAYHANRH